MLLALLVLVGGAQAATVILGFPSSDSILSGPGCGGTFPLDGGGGGMCFVAGDSLTETFAATGLANTVGSQWIFSMSNWTVVGTTNTFDVLINSVVIGSYQFTSQTYGETLGFDLDFSYLPIAGDTYTLQILATSTVPLGDGSYNWYPGGSVGLSDGAAIPEPATCGLLGLGLVAALALRARKAQ